MNVLKTGNRRRMNDAKIYIAGHSGMVGSSVLRTLRAKGCSNIITRDLEELNLTRQADTELFFKEEKPEIVVVAAARVGGIYANNTYRAEFIYQNLMIEANVIHASHISVVEKLIFLGSSCIYPKLAPQPMKEEYLLTSELEYTNEPARSIISISKRRMCFPPSYGKSTKQKSMETKRLTFGAPALHSENSCMSTTSPKRSFSCCATRMHRTFTITASCI